MWLTLASIALASAITLNILALWLSGYFERKQPGSPKTNADLPAQWASGERLSTFC
jgi:uncharacterized SAM-binding protein YcdF (DUF218 family)